MAHESRVAIGDDEMPFSFANRKLRGKVDGFSTESIHDSMSAHFRSVGQSQTSMADGINGVAEQHGGSKGSGTVGQVKCCGRWIDDSILRDEKGTGKPCREI